MLVVYAKTTWMDRAITYKYMQNCKTAQTSGLLVPI